MYHFTEYICNLWNKYNDISMIYYILSFIKISIYQERKISYLELKEINLHEITILK